jgi:positive phototaxis protein PixI
MTESLSAEILSAHSELAATVSLPDSGVQFLRLRLEPNQLALLPIQQLTEVLSISESQIMPIPHMPAWVMGVYNWRGEILWMIDLGQLCGLTAWHQRPLNRSTHTAIVLTSPDHLGLVVNQVEDIEWCDAATIQPTPVSAVTPELEQFAKAYWWNSIHSSIAILDGQALLNQINKTLQTVNS